MARRTKIVCTIGPASAKKGVLQALIRAGMDVARLNFSHGDHEQHGRVIALARSLTQHSERPLAILQDLCGPKVRLGNIAAPVAVKRGQCIRLTLDDVPGDEKSVNLPVPAIFAAAEIGDRLIADDGNVEMRVFEKTDSELFAKVIDGGVLSSRKGVACPGINLNLPAVTAKDIVDLEFGLKQGVDWVAVSFVRGPEDIAPVREVMSRIGICRPIIAKIEKLEAVHRLGQILAVVDGIMVARGDLGVEVPIDEVPIIQKKVIRQCNLAGTPVITATQMLESMVSNPRPTRAEVTDVANAILDGTDAVMLSGETAAGAYPVESCRMMAKVAANADPCLPDRAAFGAVRSGPPDITEAVAQAAVEMARSLKAAAILCATTTGGTARLTAKYRPDTPVIATTPFPETFRRLALSWGVRPLLIERVADTDEMMESSINAVIRRRLVKPGDRVILTAGIPLYVSGNTNLIKVHVVGQPLRPPI